MMDTIIRWCLLIIIVVLMYALHVTTEEAAKLERENQRLYYIIDCVDC